MHSNAAADDAVELRAWGDVRLWLCPLHEEPSSSRQAWLDAEELARAERLRLEVHRRRHLAAHAWLRQRLGMWLGVPPASLRFSATAYGKPQLRGARQVCFNLSHSGDWALICVSHQAEIGVDIELMRSLGDAAALARRHYTVDEQAACCAAGAAADHAFLSVWTRKEACLKAVGTGLRVAPSSFEVGPASCTGSARLTTPQGVRTVEVMSIETGIDAVAAVARVLP